VAERGTWAFRVLILHGMVLMNWAQGCIFFMLLERENKEAVRDSTSERRTKIFPALKVHTQILLLLLIKIGWREGKAS
jgi:hypothetical protein